MEIKRIGYLNTLYKTKFGAPRQGGVTKCSPATLIFDEEFRSKEALRGLENYSHVWVIWGFSEAKYEKFSPTVRPPRLGGNTRMGVFATRSPYRPNSLAMSAMKLEKIEYTKENGYVLRLLGADMMNGSPVYDIKPYLAFSDSIPDAVCGFTEELEDYILNVVIPPELERLLPASIIPCLKEILENDPRPSYIDTPERVFGFELDSYEIKFKVQDKTLSVVGVEKLSGDKEK